MEYKIRKIYYDISTEGRWSGTPAIFIEFADCNLSGAVSETDQNNYTVMTKREILKEVKKYRGHTVILSGGEPAMYDLYPLVHLLNTQFKYYSVHLETNGTLPIPAGIDWLVVSPKENCVVKNGEELRVIYHGQDLKNYSTYNFMCYYLQPINEDFLPQTIEVLLKNPKWNLSLPAKYSIKRSH